MNLDDPKLTAFALDELDEPEKSTIARAVAQSPEAQRFVAATRQLARTLQEEFVRADPTSTNLIDIREEPLFWARLRPLAIAAAVVLCALAVSIFLGRHATAPSQRVSEIEAVATDDTTYGTDGTYVTVASAPVAHMPMRVGTASYPNVRWLINKGLLPPVEGVRVEEMVNYFQYDYPEPDEARAFAIHVEVARCPWEPSHRLVRIGVKGRERVANVMTEIQFNPQRVASYRLIGYEKSGEPVEDVHPDGIENKSNSVTNLYEIVPADNGGSTATGQILSVKLRFKDPNERDESIEYGVVDDGAEFAHVSEDFKFAAAVAEFGMILRHSDYKGNATFDAVLAWAEAGRGTNANGERAAFVELVRKAQKLDRG
jgi:Uncharacterized protein YfbK, C-terminal/von Willebrand factor